jgi:hypothetical protein
MPRRFLNSLAFGAPDLARSCHTRISEVCIRSAFAVAVPCLLASDQRWVIHDRILDTGKKCYRAKRNRFQCVPQRGLTSTLRGRTECYMRFNSLSRKKLAPRVGFEPTACRLTAEEVKNLSAASGVAYIRLGAILTFLTAPNSAPKVFYWQRTSGSRPALY